MLIAAGMLTTMVTYESFSCEKSRLFAAAKISVTALFAVFSGSFIGFAAFALLRDIKLYIRAVVGVGIFVVSELLLYGCNKPADIIISGIFIVAAISLISLIYYGLSFYDIQKQQKSAHIMSAQISEMHEKRLNEELMKQNILAEKNARLIERENISRNIHNSVGHSITAAIMTLDAADMLYDVKPDEARKKMNDANERIRGSLESIRRAVRVLDEQSAAVSASDLKFAFENVINEFVIDTNIEVSRSFSQLSDEIKIPHDDAEFLTGMLQEMFTNGVKHGNANEFYVFLSGDTTHIKLEVSDNGKSGFNDENAENKIENGFGIKRIISYVKKHGGKTSFVNDGGFRGSAELPIIITDKE